MPLILPARTLDSGYEISNSLRFNDNDSPNLSITPSSAGNRAVWTWSAWVKISNIKSGSAPLFTAGDWTGGSTATGAIFYDSQIYTYWNAPSGGTSTTAKFRDPSAFYHIVLQANTSTLKVYVNSVEQSSKSISGNGEINNTSAQVIGKYANTTTDYFDGYMSEINFVDGSALAPTEFGETNDNGVWVPKKYSGSFGTNGFFLEFKQSGTSQNSSGIGADTSGNNNHFAVTNLAATDVTTDTPTNNFATMNPLSSSAYEGSYTFAEGNTEMHWTAHATALSTIGVSSGKWYVEVKKITSTGSHNGGIVFEKNGNVGTLIEPVASEQSACGVFPLTATGELYYNQTQQQTDASWTFAVGNIFQYYIDLDNGTLKVKKNGSDFSTAFSITLSNSNDYSSGATTFFAVGYNGDDIQVNFGNPAFSISSSNSDPNGYGSFEYSTNDGTYDYYALCTKNLAEYG